MGLTHNELIKAFNNSYGRIINNNASSITEIENPLIKYSQFLAYGPFYIGSYILGAGIIRRIPGIKDVLDNISIQFERIISLNFLHK
jgi:hypothetical protein